jgi:uncharacterized protein (DUF1501 family)
MTASSRRDFFKLLSLVGVGTLLKPKLLFAETPPKPGEKSPVLVFIFLRGAQDSLSMLSPIAEENYYKWRPNIAIKEDKSALQINNHFQLHPAMKPLYSSWHNKQLAFVTQFGSPDLTRSHFDAQDYFESGTPGEKNTNDGFLNRALKQLKNKSSMSAIALQSGMPRILKGPEQSLSITSIKDFRVPKSQLSTSMGGGFEEMYQQAADKVFRGVGTDAFESIALIKAKTQHPSNAEYPKSTLANNLKDIASLIKSDLGLSIAVTEMGGWDTHVNQGSNEGQLAKRLDDLSSALEAFTKDLGNSLENTLIVACTEFGRTVHENGNKGTDHGHGSTALLLGGNINGGKLYGKWSELKKENLHEERDIVVSTDYRSLMTAILNSHLDIKDANGIFPNYQNKLDDWSSLFRPT